MRSQEKDGSKYDCREQMRGLTFDGRLSSAKTLTGVLIETGARPRARVTSDRGTFLAWIYPNWLSSKREEC